MNPGPARILTCPHCGAKKEVMSLVSGNTCGQTLWSDTKSIAPMLPRVSFVQKCPQCGGYFFLSRQKKNEYGEKVTFYLGNLSYQELKEAWTALKTLPDLTEQEKTNILFMQVWAFNDEYTREKDLPIPAEEKAYFYTLADELIAMEEVDELLKCELLRETGRFEDAITRLKSFNVSNEFLIELKKKFLEHAQAHDTRPFLIY